MSTSCHGGAKQCSRHVRWVFLALLASTSGVALAADVPCGVGTRVHGDMGGGVPGEIVEVGNAPPYVGWYRIVFSWNAPKGDWFLPTTWDVHPEGTSDRCIVASTAAAPPRPAGTTTAPAAAATADAAKPASSESCPRGNAVVDRRQQRGEVLGESNGMCVVRLADGSTRSYLAWMLSADTGEAAAVAGLPDGTYVCSADGAGIFRIELDDGSYVDRAGKRGSYSVDNDSGVIAFSSGSLAGYHSKVLGSGKFGLASEPTTMFYTVCNLQTR